MAFDGMVMRAVVHELQTCVRGRIGKIVMPGPYELELHIRSNGQNYRWMLSADHSVPRTHLRQLSVDRPSEPPAFCMLLRKQLEGGWIEAIRQFGDERVIHLHVRSMNELGDPVTRVLVFELMGRHSNLILLNSDPLTGEAIVMDSIHHITPSVSRHRTVLPGSTYVAPPEQTKHSLFTQAGWENIVAVLSAELLPYLDDAEWEKVLVRTISGWSPLLARHALLEITSSGHSRSVSSLLKLLAGWRSEWLAHRYTPTCGNSANGQLLFSIIPMAPSALEQQRSFSAVSTCLEFVFHERAELEKRRQRAHDLFQIAQSERNKTIAKSDKLRDQLIASEDAEEWRQKGELLVAMQHTVARGSTSVTLINYFDEAMPEITLTLDPTKSAGEQSQAFFKKYNKLKTAVPLVREQLVKAESDLVYWETLLQQLELASYQDLEEIREELIALGFVRVRQKSNARKKQNAKLKPQPMHIRSSDGISIYVGKNNLQNDYVTFRLGQDQHWWLHTKDIPGSHVLIQDPNPPEATVREAVMLAAWFSKARQSSQVPVDMTRIRHVRKPGGAKPGFVIYEQQRTLFITVEEIEITRLIETSKK